MAGVNLRIQVGLFSEMYYTRFSTDRFTSEVSAEEVNQFGKERHESRAAISQIPAI